MTAFQPLGKQNTSDLVFNQLLARISEGEWVDGDRIPSENELRESLGVSRDSVREAIKRLAAMGLLRSEQGKGTFVRKIDTGFYLNMLIPTLFLSEDEGLHILQFMKAIQVESARIAAETATEEDPYALIVQTYDQYGRPIESEYYRQDGSPATGPEGSARV